MNKVLNLAIAIFGVAVIIGTPQVTSAATTKACTDRYLSRGSSHKVCVETLQTLLKSEADDNLTVDGKFGKDTRQVVRDYQQSHDLRVDGIVGPQTWTVLCDDAENSAVKAWKNAGCDYRAHRCTDTILTRGTRSTCVYRLQQVMNDRSANDIKTDGVFGSETAKAVRAFKTDAKLDGKTARVDNAVWKAICTIDGKVNTTQVYDRAGCDKY